MKLQYENTMMNIAVFFCRKSILIQDNIFYAKVSCNFQFIGQIVETKKFKIESQAMAAKLANRDTRCFWKAIRSIKAAQSNFTYAVDENQGQSEIAGKWQHQCRHRFICIENSKSNFHVYVWSVEIEPFSRKEICLLSEKLGRNQSGSADDIPADVYK